MSISRRNEAASSSSRSIARPARQDVVAVAAVDVIVPGVDGKTRA
jgi:hypothetical protein